MYVGVIIDISGRGVIETPMVGSLTDQHKTASNARNALGRCGTAEEVAELISFLLSDKSSFCTGTVGYMTWYLPFFINILTTCRFIILMLGGRGKLYYPVYG